MSQWWGLTTVNQHAHEQGERAALTMIRALSVDEHNGDTSRPEREDLQVELVVRATTGPVRNDDSV
jgi:DNA-binding LacI/PurR family transcriptional regulator